MRHLPALLLQTLLLMMVFLAPPGAAQESTDPQPLTLAKWAEIRGSLLAFGVELYDAEGKRLDFKWVDDPALVAQFVAAMPAEGESDTILMRIPAQPTLVHTADGQIFSFAVVSVEQGLSGAAMLEDGIIELGAGLDAVIAKGYGLSEFSSSDNTFQRLSVDIGNAVASDEAPAAIDLNRLAASRGAEKPVDVLVFAPESKVWADLIIGARKDAIGIPVQPPAQTTANLLKLKKSGFCARNLSFAVHAWPGTMELGPHPSPSSSYVSAQAWGTPVGDFANGISAVLCPGATVRLLSCQLVATPLGKSFLADFAAAINATTYGYDDLVYFGLDKKDATLPKTSTRGALWKAQPDGTPPVKVTAASKARIIEVFK